MNTRIFLVLFTMVLSALLRTIVDMAFGISSSGMTAAFIVHDVLGLLTGAVLYAVIKS